MENQRRTVFLVDDNMTNLMAGKDILSPKYNTFTIPSGEKLFQILERLTPDLILLDVEMPEMNGYETLKRLRENEKAAGIPVIFLTIKNDTGSELKGLSLGAIDYIYKPFSPVLLLKRIETHLLVMTQRQVLKDYYENLEEMVREKTATLLDLQNAVLSTVANLVEYRDDITGGHIERTSMYLEILLNALETQHVYADEIRDWNRDFLLQSCKLHDAGKIRIRGGILRKPGRLTEEETEEMKKHPLYGVAIIEAIKKNAKESSFLKYAKIFAGTHHEKWDGTGYPYGLKETGIPLEGRLMAIVDVYDALSSPRSYKKPYSHEKSIRIIAEGRGTHFDPVLVDLLLSVSGEFAAVSRQSMNGRRC
ncbi:MAG: response regulator [Treponema sp.]|jgi:putative two-component system response regulator|nr:response regulator [Treponema sp.]